MYCIIAIVQEERREDVMLMPGRTDENLNNRTVSNGKALFALKIQIVVLPRRAMLCIARTMLSQCVCPSVTRRYSVETAQPIIKFFQPGSHTILAFPNETIWQCSDGDPLQRDMKKSLFSCFIACCQRCDRYVLYIHCVPKQTVVPNFGDNFVRSQPISKIIALLYREKNFQQTVCNNSHHTLDMLLHYLVKYNNSELTQITHKMQ